MAPPGLMPWSPTCTTDMARGSKHGIDRSEWEQRRTEFVRRGLDLPQTKLMPLDVSEIRSPSLPTARARP